MSGRKNVLIPFKIIDSGDMSTASITSKATNIQWLDNICIELVFTGTPTGTFQIQGSLDHKEDANGNITQAGNWVPITLDPVPVASGSAGAILIDMKLLSFPWIRVVYTKTSGNGSLTATIGGKQV